MARFKRGRPITANALNETTGEAQTGANPSVTSGTVHVGPRGHHIHHPPPRVGRIQTGVPAKFTTPGDVGRFQLVEIYDARDDAFASPPVLHVRRPQVPGTNALGITLGEISTGGIGNIAVTGHAPLYFTDHPRPTVSGSGSYGDWYPIEDGTRLGTMGEMTNDYYGHWQPLGPLELVKVFDTVDAGGYSEGGACGSFDIYLGLVNITGNRGGEQLIEDGNQGINKPFSALYLDANFELSTVPGPVWRDSIIYVELA